MGDIHRSQLRQSVSDFDVASLDDVENRLFQMYVLITMNETYSSLRDIASLREKSLVVGLGRLFRL